MNEIHILFACDAWAGRDSMRIQGITTDDSTLQAMVAAKIKSGDMEYAGFSDETAYRHFLWDFKNGEIDYSKLQYGFVETYYDMQIADPITVEEFPQVVCIYKELTGVIAKQAMEALKLDRRSLNFSEVEVHTGCDYASFFVPGFCDRDLLERSDQYQEMMENSYETEVTVDISVYSVGQNESESPNENELELIRQYWDEIEEEYGIDQIQTDFISFEFKPEE